VNKELKTAAIQLQYLPLQDLFLQRNLIYYYYFMYKRNLILFYNTLSY